MHHVSLSDSVMEPVIDAVVAVDGTQGTTHKRELLGSVVRNRRVGMLQIGVQN